MADSVTIRCVAAVDDIDPALVAALGGDPATLLERIDLRIDTEHVEAPCILILIAESGSAQAGILVSVRVPKLDRRRGFLFVDELYVLPAFRHRGIARALLNGLVNRAKREGLAGVRLLARPGNSQARNLYLSAGFIETEALFYQRLIGDEQDLHYNCGL